jgi:hypothetical protein
MLLGHGKREQEGLREAIFGTMEAQVVDVEVKGLPSCRRMKLGRVQDGGGFCLSTTGFTRTRYRLSHANKASSLSFPLLFLSLSLFFISLLLQTLGTTPIRGPAAGMLVRDKTATQKPQCYIAKRTREASMDMSSWSCTVDSMILPVTDLRERQRLSCSVCPCCVRIEWSVDRSMEEARHDFV